ncbi:HAD family phosphatase [Lactobacillus sp. DCY120]|uniref:HAD family phosphatase n=1 Tax=Bombilactobacillus apium TaxID=2675299 RepID=A0A850R1T3_9LACO|nr:Cof-type HAD-IIB family hydrolase [Bombilactobacillus apium]NVY97079.1 HAD family phosphatase [Bombilactobacillus apium]
MIKLIASDMDGTLLNQQSRVSALNIATINQAHAQGIKFAIATGRTLDEARPFVRKLNFQPDFITLNGALVYNQQFEPVVQIPLRHLTLQHSIQILQKYNLYFELVTNAGLYSNSRQLRLQNMIKHLQHLNPTLLYKKAFSQATARLPSLKIHYVPDYQQLLQTKNIKVFKIIAFNLQDSPDFTDAKQELALDDQAIITSSGRNNLEINDRQAQKGLALKKLAQQLGFDLKEVMAIGDNLNDFSMIQTAGVGVAMGNALPEIKEIAQYQTATNVQDGVAQAVHYARQLQ